jgi:CRISPR/Cas system-associated exonuclease Cas4 (RecB family)
MDYKLSYSPSSLGTYATCPHKFYAEKFGKTVPIPEHPSATKGKEIHAELESAGKLNDLENPIIAALPAGERHHELKLAIDGNFRPCDWDKGVVRCILDVLILQNDRPVILDFKTGRRKPNELQLLINAYLTLVHFDELPVKAGYLWLKCGSVDFYEWKPIDIKRKFNAVVDTILKIEASIPYGAEAFLKTPSGLCGFCGVKSCQYNTNGNLL